MAKSPPKFTIPPAPPKKASTGRSAVISKWYASHGSAMQKLRTTIEQYAAVYGVPEMALAAVIYKESKGNNEAAPAEDGWGVTQLNINSPPSAAEQVLGRKMTEADAMNPDTAIHILAQTYANAGTGSDVDRFYETVWNPGWKPSAGSFGGTPPSGFIKGTPVYTGKPTPTQKVGGSVATAQAKAANTVEQQVAAKKTLDPIYLAYTGKVATPAEINNYIKNPQSTYQIELGLGNIKTNPALANSPVWKNNAATYESYYKDIFGPKATVPKNVIAYGIVNSLSETAFKADLTSDKIKGQQQYEKSEQYQQLYAQYNSAYTQIYGKPDPNGQASIKMAINGGWSADQFNNWLRNQPEYKNSNEYKVRSINLAQSMGLLTQGEAQTVLSKAVTQEPYTGVAYVQPSPPTVSVSTTKPKATPPQVAPPPQVPQLTSENGQGGGRRG